MPSCDPLLKILAQKIFVSVEITRSTDIHHTLIIHNQSELTVELLNIKITPHLPLGFGLSASINDSKIFKNQTLIPGQKIINRLDTKAIKDKKSNYKIFAEYKTYLFNKMPYQPIQKSNIFTYKPLGHTVPIRNFTEMRS